MNVDRWKDSRVSQTNRVQEEFGGRPGRRPFINLTQWMGEIRGKFEVH
jgi:hypothetical protein